MTDTKVEYEDAEAPVVPDASAQTAAPKDPPSRRKVGRKKGSTNKSPSAAAVKVILRMPLGALTQFAKILADTDRETAVFLAEKLMIHATVDDDSSAERSD